MKSESDNLVPISSMKAPITNLTLRIIKEYQDLVPHQSEQEYHELIHSLKVNGFWEHCPIVISEEGIILDGHHRWWAWTSSIGIYLEKLLIVNEATVHTGLCIVVHSGSA